MRLDELAEGVARDIRGGRGELSEETKEIARDPGSSFRDRIVGMAIQDSQDEWDFSDEPIFDDSGEVRVFPIPGHIDQDGKPISWITVRGSVDYCISVGRAKFAEQRQRFTRDQKGKRQLEDQMVVGYDVFGLFLYKVRNCLDHSEPRVDSNGVPVCGWKITDKRTGKVIQSNKSEAHTQRIFSEIKSSKLCTWIGERIDEVLGWGDEEETRRSRFSGEPEETDQR